MLLRTFAFRFDVSVEESEMKSMKKIRLNSSSVSKEAISAAAAETLRAGGWVEAPPERKVGDQMPDGTIYAGISPETRRPMYTTSPDALVADTFNGAREYAAKLDAYGYRDWRLPTSGELQVLFNGRAAIGGFNEARSNATGWLWSSSSPNEDYTWVQRFSD